MAYGNLIVLLICLLLANGCSEAPDGKPKSQATPAPVAQVVYADLMVNGSPAPQLTADLPVVLTVSLQNPSPKTPVRLGGLAGLKPRLRPDTGRDTSSATWQTLPLPTGELPPGATAKAGWVLEGGLAQGTYWLSLDGAEALAVNAQGQALTVKAAPLRLVIVPGSADPARLAALRRRLLALRGDKAAYLDAVRRALEKEPDSHPLGFELVQALDINGQPAEAGRALADLIDRAEARFKQKHPGENLHLPSWYYTYQRELQRRGAATEGKKGP